MAVTRVSFKHSRPTTPGRKDSAWDGLEVGFEYDSVTQNEADLSADVDTLRALSMIAVFEGLGIEYTLNPENGIPEPVIEVSAIPQASPPRKPYQGTSSTPKFDVSGLPTITVDGVIYHDYRDAKAQEKVKPRFPDFKSTDGKISEWLLDKDENPTKFALKLSEVGLL